MGIRFDEKSRIFYLDSRDMTYAMQLTNDDMVVRHLYWGKRLNKINNPETITESLAGWVDVEDVDFKDKLMPERVLQECATDGGGDLRYPAYSAKKDGFYMLLAPRVKGYEIVCGKPEPKGLPHTYTEDDSEAETLILTVEDESGIRIKLFYTVFNGFNALVRRAEIENFSDSSFILDRALSASVDFMDRDFEVINLVGGCRREKNIKRDPIQVGTYMVSSNRGVSGHLYDPSFALIRKSTTEDSGECFAMSLVYSGNFVAGTELSSNTGTVRAFIGINPDRFEWLLNSGECFSTPEAVMVYTDKGIGEMSRCYHDIFRKRLCRGYWRDKVRPVLFNNWEGTYFEFTEEKVLSIARFAKDVGAELMVLDDGWFGKRDVDDCSLGDWVAHKKKLPDGVEGLADKITSLGIKFGLWFEPECVSPDSDLHRSHPDWHINVPGRKASMSRNQWILDLSNPEVQDYLIEAVSDVLGRAKISYVKWDYNRNMSELGSAYLPSERMGELPHRYILGLYRILDELNNRFPEVLFEGCAGGGGRYDAGMLYYMPQTWASDCSDAAERLKIQYGTSIMYPANTMGAHISAVPNHQVGRTTPMKMRGEVAMFGQFGCELDPQKLSKEEADELKVLIAYYKNIREAIQFGSMYRLSSPFDGKCTAWNFISDDKTTVVLGIFNAFGIPLGVYENIKLSGLDENASYKDVESGKTYGGDELMKLGFMRRFEKDFISEIIVFKKI